MACSSASRSIGRVTGQMGIQISQRVDAADGRFLGVVVFSAVADPAHHAARSIDLGPRRHDRAVRTDNIVRARFGADSPDGTNGVGRHCSVARCARRCRRSAGPRPHLGESGRSCRQDLQRPPASPDIRCSSASDSTWTKCWRRPARMPAEIEVSRGGRRLLLCGLLAALISEVRRRARHEAQLAAGTIGAGRRHRTAPAGGAAASRQRAEIPGYCRGQRRLDLGNRCGAPVHLPDRRMRSPIRNRIGVAEAATHRQDAVGTGRRRSRTGRKVAPAQGRPGCAPAVPAVPLCDHEGPRARCGTSSVSGKPVFDAGGDFPRLSRHRHQRDSDGRGAGAGGASRDLAARCHGQRVRRLRHLRQRRSPGDVQRGVSPPVSGQRAI